MHGFALSAIKVNVEKIIVPYVNIKNLNFFFL